MQNLTTSSPSSKYEYRRTPAICICIYLVTLQRFTHQEELCLVKVKKKTLQKPCTINLAVLAQRRIQKDRDDVGSTRGAPSESDVGK